MVTLPPACTMMFPPLPGPLRFSANTPLPASIMTSPVTANFIEHALPDAAPLSLQLMVP